MTTVLLAVILCAVVFVMAALARDTAELLAFGLRGAREREAA